MAFRHSPRRKRAARRTDSPAVLLWLLVVLSVGALGGIAGAKYLSRRDRLQAEDPDAPLFI